MQTITTVSTDRRPMVQRLHLASETSGYILHRGDLMRLVSLRDVDGRAIAELAPASLEEPLAAH